MASEVVPACLAIAPRQTAFFRSRGQRCQVCWSQLIHGESRACVLCQSSTVADKRYARTQAVEVSGHMIVRQHAVAVEKE